MASKAKKTDLKVGERVCHADGRVGHIRTIGFDRDGRLTLDVTTDDGRPAFWEDPRDWKRVEQGG